MLIFRSGLVLGGEELQGVLFLLWYQRTITPTLSQISSNLRETWTMWTRSAVWPLTLRQIRVRGIQTFLWSLRNKDVFSEKCCRSASPNYFLPSGCVSSRAGCSWSCGCCGVGFLFVGAASHEDKLMMRERCKSWCLRRSGNLIKPSSLWHDSAFVSSTEAAGGTSEEGVLDLFLLFAFNQTLTQIFRRAWKIHQLLFKLLLLLIISTMSKKLNFISCSTAVSNITTQLKYFHTT